jgi:signal transduction histidine kinase
MTDTSERDEIMRMVVHDVRGPITSIITGLTFVQDLLHNPEHKDDIALIDEILELALESAMGLTKLINAYIEITSPDLVLKREPVALDELVQSALLTVTNPAQKANITLETDIPDDLPLVNVDGEKIRRVLAHLLENALHFTPDGGTILVSAHRHDSKIVIQVADSGVGIPPDEREKVFERFWRSREIGPLRRHVGFGLGLTFCKMIVEAHGERIDFEDGPLSGACATLTLPIP